MERRAPIRCEITDTDMCKGTSISELFNFSCTFLFYQKVNV